MGERSFAIPDPMRRSAAGDRNPWLVAVVISIATFMQVLDTSIANVALQYIAGQPGRERRREHLGAHELSRRQRSHPADQRLAVGRDRPQALLHGLRRRVHGELGAVRARAQSADADLLPRASGHRRRGHGAERAGDARRHFSREQAPDRIRALRGRRAGGTDRRSDARRLAHRQSVLALDFPHQRPDRRRSRSCW